VPIPLLSQGLPAALPALTNLRVSICHHADVSGLAGLRRLALQDQWIDNEPCPAVEGLSGLTALEDLCLGGDCGPMAQPSDLAPLTALTRLEMLCVPPDFGSHPVAARLRRLELQSFGVLFDAPRGGDGSGANGAAAAALAALARGAPLLERLRIHVGDRNDVLMDDYPGDVELGAPLGPGVAWPSLTHLEVTPWAALLLADCAFPRLSRLVANIPEKADGKGIASDERHRVRRAVRAAVAALAAKARDHAALLAYDQRYSAPNAVGGPRRLGAPRGVARVARAGGAPGRLWLRRAPGRPDAPDPPVPQR
jgi:hypothetical protein